MWAKLLPITCFLLLITIRRLFQQALNILFEKYLGLAESSSLSWITFCAFYSTFFKLLDIMVYKKFLKKYGLGYTQLALMLKISCCHSGKSVKKQISKFK